MLPSAATSRPRGASNRAIVVMIPVAGSILLTRPFPVSETSTAPSAATASPCGPEISAAVAGPPSPPYPCVPVPAMRIGDPAAPGSRNTRVPVGADLLGRVRDVDRGSAVVDAQERVPRREIGARGVRDGVGVRERL